MSTIKEKFESVRTSENGTGAIELSVIIAIRDPERASPIEQIYYEYKQQIERAGLRYEFIFVIGGKDSGVFKDLCRLKENGERIKILVFAKFYGEATALNAGFEHASGQIVLTLPAYRQVDSSAIPAVIEALSDTDMVIVRRWPRVDSRMNRLQTRFFHAILRKLLGVSFQDMTCSIRVMKRTVIEHVHMYGDQQRFFPILAGRFGFKVKEIEVPQSKQDAFPRVYKAGVYVRRLLDLLSIFFLVKFTAKPLRFFGLTGFSVFSIGLLFSLVLVFQRLFMGEALADRPALLFGVLLIVLGILLFAIGLVGELIIFVHAKDLKEYRIEEIVN